MPLTYDSIIPVGTKLKYIGSGSLNPESVYIVKEQHTDDITYWLYLIEENSKLAVSPNGWNPRSFELLEEPLPDVEVWTL